ncbi:MAG: DNA cytosine methyltransferase [Luteolibacter sp.]
MKKYRIADLFCGAGGTSAGAVEASQALGYLPEVTAVNHWPVAIATHTKNHPGSRHLCTGIDSINPRELFGENELDLLWASPECTHHSIARGGKPINDQSRATAWCVTRWAEALRPPVILIENVPEFATWGPIGSNGKPLKSKKSETFAAWCAALRSLGYKVDHRLLCAADYGDPTTRTRLFVQAVRGRRRIVWPNATHSSDGDLLATRRWTPAREIIDWDIPSTSIFERKKPLSPKTMARIEAGLKKFGLKGFIVPQFGEREGQAPRTHNLDHPAPAVTSHGAGALVRPFLVELKGSTEAAMERTAKSVDQPLGAVMAGGTHHALAEPYLVNMKGQSDASDIDAPAPTITAHAPYLYMVEPHLLPQQSAGRLRSVNEPAPTVSTAGAIALVKPFLVSFYGNGQPHDLGAPTPTVTCKDRFGLVKPVVEVNGERYLLDIHFRMLQPHELALAQGFPAHYRFTGTKTDQVKQIGNAVPRRLARALVAAVLSQNEDVSALVDAEEGAEVSA